MDDPTLLSDGGVYVNSGTVGDREFKLRKLVSRPVGNPYVNPLPTPKSPPELILLPVPGSALPPRSRGSTLPRSPGRAAVSFQPLVQARHHQRQSNRLPAHFTPARLGPGLPASPYPQERTATRAGLHGARMTASHDRSIIPLPKNRPRCSSSGIPRPGGTVRTGQQDFQGSAPRRAEQRGAASRLLCHSSSRLPTRFEIEHRSLHRREERPHGAIGRKRHA